MYINKDLDKAKKIFILNNYKIEIFLVVPAFVSILLSFICFSYMWTQKIKNISIQSSFTKIKEINVLTELEHVYDNHGTECTCEIQLYTIAH